MKKKSMQIVYVSSLTSEEKMNQIIQNSKNKPLQSIQKFHRLMCEGFVKNDIDVQTITAIPMSRNISNKIIWYEKKETINGVKYEYLPFLNFQLMRQLCILFSTLYKTIKKCIFSRNNNLFICDVLNTTISMTTLIITKIFRKKCIAIVTDLPRDIGSNKSISRKINEFFQNKYDGYIILTEEMNKIVNPNNRPYVVIEGIADIQMEKIENKLEQKESKKVCIYAGGLYTKYGVDCLIEAFLKLENSDVVLEVYGDGELTEKIKNIQDPKIKYMGVVPNRKVVQKEIKATLLINPRFTNEEYTKYSFPSKNMEYMSTGTPVLTTKLPGMPKEYNPYVYLFDEETVNGFYKKIKQILDKTEEELWKKGKEAKEFILKNKNNQVQTKKILEMIDKIEQNR